MTPFQAADSFEQRVGVVDPFPLPPDKKRRGLDWQVVTFDPPFSAGKRVVVMAMFQEWHGENGFEIRDITVSSFEVCWNSERPASENYPLGWVAYAF